MKVNRLFISSVSNDGSVVVGSSGTYYGGEAFIWDANNGMRGLDIGGVFGRAVDISGDGSIVVGNRDYDGAFIWDVTNQTRSLKSALQDDYGLDLTGWYLASVTSISEDGSTIVGGGLNPEGQVDYWMAKLDPVSTPEPASIAGLLAVGLLGMKTLKRK